MSHHAGALRPLWRGLRFLEHLTTGVLILLYVRLVSREDTRPAWLPAVVQWWYGRLCRALGLRVSVSGTIARGCLLVSNHVSWLDPVVLGAQGHPDFLAKSEVRGWPVIGWMSVLVGTLFIARGANQVGAVTAEIGTRIAGGGTVAIFPEGTTSDGSGVRRFYSRLFASVQRPGLGVQPVALSYRSRATGEQDLEIAFIDDQTLIANVWSVLRHPGLVAEVQFLPAFWPDAEDQRRALSARARLQILNALGLPESAGLNAPPNGPVRTGRVAARDAGLRDLEERHV